MSKKLPKAAIQRSAEHSVQLSPRDQAIFGLVSAKDGTDADHQRPFVALKYFQDSWECFSSWEKDELKEFSEFLRRLGSTSWGEIYRAAGSKRGLSYTAYDPEKASKAANEHFKTLGKQISPDLTLFELRVNQKKLRVHGFRAASTFFLVLLDREHRVWPV